MASLIGDTVPKRKMCLANLVQAHLQTLGHEASIVENRENSAGHTDRVVVESSIGIIHLTASSSTEPNATIRATDYHEGKQAFLADKDYVAYGWNTKDNRTMIIFVPASSVEGKESLTKSEIRDLSDRTLTKVLRLDSDY